MPLRIPLVPWHALAVQLLPPLAGPDSGLRLLGVQLTPAEQRTGGHALFGLLNQVGAHSCAVVIHRCLRQVVRCSCVVAELKDLSWTEHLLVLLLLHLAHHFLWVHCACRMHRRLAQLQH